MMIKRFLLVLVIACIVVGSAGCSRSKATPPPPIGKATNQPTNANQNLGIIPQIATQTAVAAALQKTLAPVPVGETAVAPEATTAATNNESTPSISVATATQVLVIATPVTVPPATPGIPASYTLQKGEFPYCIARRFNLNPYELLNVNGLSTSTGTSPGMTLKLPQTGNTFPADRSLHSHPTTYKVNAGDTIYSIGCYYGDVDPMVIAAVNGIASPYTIKAGQVLNIP